MSAILAVVSRKKLLGSVGAAISELAKRKMAQRQEMAVECQVFRQRAMLIPKYSALQAASIKLVKVRIIFRKHIMHIG